MFKSKIFLGWFIGMLVLWAILFGTFNNLQFLKEHWYYPAIMVLGAFVAGLTPEGGGAVAFPVLSVFFNIDRVLARDFSLMIQSIGMTSASIFVVTNKANDLKAYQPLLWFIPVCFGGFVFGMLTLQQLPVFVIQALFLSLITTFAIAYYFSDHRGHEDRLNHLGRGDIGLICFILFLGGMCASLFGTGADIILYTLMVTRFRMKEKAATHLSIMLMASMSVLGYLYRHFIDQSITSYQIQTWLCAYPVVLFMAPFGTYILAKIHVDWMLKGIVILNIGQLLYFNINKPSVDKLIVSLLFSAILWWIFHRTLARISKSKKLPSTTVAAPEVESTSP